jgi:2-phosphoglycerate kinase
MNLNVNWRKSILFNGLRSAAVKPPVGEAFANQAAKRMAAMRAEIMEMRRARAIMLKRERENYDKLCERVNELRAIRQLWITRLASR